MIIKKEELNQLEKYFAELEAIDGYCTDAIPDPIEFFGERPHLLLASGFNTARKLVFGEQLYDLPENTTGKEYDLVEKQITDTKIFIETHGFQDFSPFMHSYGEYAFQQKNNGAWYWLDGFQDQSLFFRGATSIPIEKDELLTDIENFISAPPFQAHSIILPRFGIEFGSLSNSLLTETKKNLIKLYKNEIQIEDINPFEFEDLIAELLSDAGFTIHQTKRTADGGRDLVVKGEAVPGYEIVMAVEVKHKRKVGKPDISKVLYDNRNFPKIMLATSGTFSAIVIKEAMLDENYYRLELKDGLAIFQMIQGYGKKYIGGI